MYRTSPALPFFGYCPVRSPYREETAYGESTR